MTVYTLTDVARARIDALSFFLAGYLLIGWFVKLLWNNLARSFPSLPRLTYLRALCLLMVTGLLFYVVLTMISGARELLTPGAWEKQGTGYRLREKGGVEIDPEQRRAALRDLQTEIWKYAAAHGGKPPTGLFQPGIPDSAWKYPGGGFYAYLPAETLGNGRGILAYEPSLAGPRRFVLMLDGTIEDWTEGKLKDELDQRDKR